MSSLWIWCKELWLDELLPYAGARSSQRVLKQQIADVQGAEELPPDLKPQLHIDLGKLEQCHTAEKDRKKTAEDKAKTNITAVTVSFAILSAALGFIKGGNPLPNTGLWGFFLAGLIILGFLSILLGGLAAFQALRIEVVWDLYVDVEAQLVGSPDEWRKEQYIRSIALNQKMTNMRTNLVDASYGQIRNGIACMAAFAILLAVVLGLSSNKVQTASLQVPQTEHHETNPPPKDPSVLNSQSLPPCPWSYNHPTAPYPHRWNCPHLWPRWFQHQQKPPEVR